MKKATGILSGICALILCFVALGTNIACQSSPTASGQVISITYDFPEPGIEEASGAPLSEDASPLIGDYVSVTMEGLPQGSEPGLPVLPFKASNILLPCGFDVDSIIVTCGDEIAVPGSYVVEVGQEPVPLSYEGPLEVTPPRSDVYDSLTPFPGRLYSDDMIQNKAGYRILLVNLHPIEYIPELGQLSYYESLTIEVKLRAAVVEAEWQRVSRVAQDEETVREIVDNPEAISTYRAIPSSFEVSPLLATGDYEYVIITSAALNATSGPNNFQALRDDKISRNITATIVTTEWIYANYSGARPDGGADNQTKIRNFIIDAYNNWGTRYVLLGGDGDGANAGGESGDNIIPHRGFAVYDPSWADNDIPADMYYACLDGSFDYDADGIYGEPTDGPNGGEVDLFAEVYVGRAPVDSQTEVQNFVRKTLAYQNTPLTDANLGTVWMVGEQLDSNTWGGDYKDDVKTGSSAYSYTTVGFENSAYASGFNVSTLYDRDYSGHNWPTSDIVGIINNNVHLINHEGHANVWTVMKMLNSDADGLTNSGLYFIGYSQGCYAGSFDDRTITPGTYANYDCISEHLVTGAHGAAAFIANSRYGWYSSGSTYGYSQHFDREFWDAVLGEYKYNIGVANQDSKEDNAGRISNWADRWCYYEINLFGDPELTIKLQGAKYESHDIDDSTGGDSDGYPEPGESISMPVTLRNISTDTLSNVSSTLNATTLATTTIFSENFDGSWPGSWTVSDWDSNSGDDYWGPSNYRAYSGNFSAYCARVSDVSGQYYDNDMQAFMGRDVNLSAYTSATLNYKYWIDCQSYNDYLEVAYFDGSWHYVKYYTSSSSGWASDSMSVPSTATKVGFLFTSDGSTTGEGAYIDDVVLAGPSYVSDPYISITDGSEGYGSIPVGDTATSLGAYDFTIDADCPADHVVRFNLNITASSGGPFTDSFDQILPLKYDLTISSTTGGTVTTPGEDTFTYDGGTVVSLVAVPDSGCQFDEWTGNVSDIANAHDASTTITMNGDSAITANFEEVPASPVYPTVTTQTASNINTSSATLNMGYTVGDFSPVDVCFAYKKSVDSAWSSTDWVSMSESGTYAESCSGLDSSTDYDFKAELRYDSTVIEGTALQFTTEATSPSPSPPATAGCFIATAAYGTPMAQQIQILREFRDEYLLTNTGGQAFVDFYYQVSPPIADFITEHAGLKPVVRAGLAPVVAMSNAVVNTSSVEKMGTLGFLVLVCAALVVWATRRRGHGEDYA
jgi:hypothetical protein